jgi:hypothetical protein
MAVYEDQEPTPMLTCRNCKCSSPVALWWRKNADTCDICHWYKKEERDGKS